MKLLFIIGDLSKNSVERQLAEFIQKIMKGEAVSEVLETFELSECETSIKSADAIWFIINGESGVCPSLIFNFVKVTKNSLRGKYCTLSSVGGDDGGEIALKELYDEISGYMNVMDDEVTCIPMISGRFEFSRDYKMDLFWQKEALLKFFNIKDVDADRREAICAVAKNYLVLMKSVAVDKLKPSQIQIDYPNIVTDVGVFDFLNLPKHLKELHYEIDALTSDYDITNEEIEDTLKVLVREQW